jgi:predicted HAD superfamily Cof-like phosphohydrolase|tara:strand:- start:133 stop:528 length:396 start_codon:yes stop_codon:yes gene_type:complete
MMPKYRTMQDAVTEFQKAFGRPTDLKFSDIEISSDVANTFGLRQALIEEEFYELTKAMNEKNEQEIKKESADLLYVLAGLFVDFGWDMQVIFNRIHESNMSKLDENGKPVYRKDGKIMKSNRYKQADLRGV